MISRAYSNTIHLPIGPALQKYRVKGNLPEKIPLLFFSSKDP
jgi:hypothetical protein